MALFKASLSNSSWCSLYKLLWKRRRFQSPHALLVLHVSRPSKPLCATIFTIGTCSPGISFCRSVLIGIIILSLMTSISVVYMLLSPDDKGCIQRVCLCTCSSKLNCSAWYVANCQQTLSMLAAAEMQRQNQAAAGRVCSCAAGAVTCTSGDSVKCSAAWCVSEEFADMAAAS